MNGTTLIEKPSCELDLTGLIPEQEWRMHRRVLDAALASGKPFAVGGGLAFSAYSGRWRNTKDIDLFVLPEDRHEFAEIVTSSGFADYYAWKPYDRSWIFRGWHDGTIVDIIWTMPNHLMEVDLSWLDRGPEVTISGMRLNLVPVEELIWSKLFVIQRDRTDWPDLLNVMHESGDRIDWDYLIDRLNGDADVLAGLMCLYRWLCSEQAGGVPRWVWHRLGLSAPESDRPCADASRRAFLLDTRDWFGPTAEMDRRS